MLLGEKNLKMGVFVKDSFPKKMKKRKETKYSENLPPFEIKQKWQKYKKAIDKRKSITENGKSLS